jgi:3',5'-cyclic AMP phosphodiesterase CpdA
MRLAHLTDVHFFVPPPFAQARGKRLLGLLNLYLGGRRHYFDAARQVEAAIADLGAQEVDAVLFTGDLSATSLPAEFEAAARALAPLLRRTPTILLPGNHDRYTKAAAREARMESHFGPWMRGGTWEPSGARWTGEDSGLHPHRFRLGPIDVIATDPCRPGLRAMGHFEPGAIEKAEHWVQEGRSAGRFVIYLLHYPPLDADGTPYRHGGHHLADVDALLRSLRRSPPDIVLHGHKHRAWRTTLRADDGRTVPIWNCGSSSAVTEDVDRVAGYFLFDIEEGRIRSVRRRILRPGRSDFEDHPRAEWGG